MSSFDLAMLIERNKNNTRNNINKLFIHARIFDGWVLKGKFLMDDPFWNDFEIKAPAITTLPLKCTRFAQLLHPIIQRFLKLDTDENVELTQAAALLSRLMARRKNSFRRMIGFRSIQKLNAALGRLLRLDLPRALRRFQSALPDMSYESSDTANVPTRNCLDYVLVRLFAARSLYGRIRQCGMEAATHLAKMLRNNFFVEINTLLLAVIAKLHKFVATFGNRCVELYRQLYTRRQHFPHVDEGYTFLPAHLQLPTTLSQITGVDSKTPTITGETSEVSLLLAADPLKALPTSLRPARLTLDMGTAVQRAPKQAPFNPAQLDSVDEVKKFIAVQNREREASPQSCVTKKVLDHEWLGVQKLFERKLTTGDHKKALNVFRKFIASKVQ